MPRELIDSGIEWIGEIPSNWEVQRTKNSYTHHKDIAGESSEEHERLALTLQGVIKRSKEDSKGLQPGAFDGYQILKENDLVFKLIDLENISTSRIGLSPFTGLVSPAYICLTGKNNANPRFGEYYFCSMWQREIFNHMGDDGVRSSLNAKDLLEVPFIVPSPEEQQRIADFLDDKCSRIDAAIEKTQKTIKKYKALKQSIISEAVTKGIHGDRSMKDSGIECIGEIPSEWTRAKMKWLCKLITDGSHFSPESIDDGYPYITAKDVHGEGITYKNANKISYDDYILLEKNGCRPRKDDVLLVKDGATTGRVGRMMDDTECVLLSSVAKLTPNEKYVTSKYLMYLLMSDALQKQITIAMAGSAMPRITLIKLVNFYGLVCPINEQLEIVAYLDKKCESIGKLITAKETILKELETYKKSLIYEYVTGKKEVLT